MSPDQPPATPPTAADAALTSRGSASAEIAALARHVLASLTATGQTLACAESLTGGWLTASLIDVPGASRVVRGGMVSYATDLKASWLDVDPELLAARGAVDPTVAGDMALGVCRAAGSDWGLSTTGVAGPGPSEGKLAGTAYVAVAVGTGVLAVREVHIVGDRAQVRAATVVAALALLAEQVDRR